MGTNQPNQNTARVMDQKIIRGVAKHFAKVTTVTLAGTSYTPAALTAVLQAEIDANTALDQNRAQMKEQVEVAREARAKARAVRKAIRAYVLGTSGANAVQLLEDFGISPPKTPGAKTAEAKARAAAKGTATKKAKAAALKAVTRAPSTAAP
ncbi:MAG TPA: hypothetical protein VGI39_24065 [Polyangiaceae bacterium]